MKIEKLAAMLLAGSGILFSSCNDRIETDTPTTPTDWGNELRAELSVVAGEPQTRAYNRYIYEVLWESNDQILVKDANNSATFTLVDGADTDSGVFRQNSGTPLSGTIKAFYPAGIGETMQWPATMTEDEAMPMYSAKDARSEGDETLKFKSLGSVVNLVFNSQTQGATLQSITLSADQPLSGAFTVDADGKAVLADEANGTVTLDLGSDGKALTSPAAYSFYLYVPSGNYTNLTATFNAIGRKPYVCNFGAKTLHHNAVEKFSVAGRLPAYTVTFNTRGYAKDGTAPAEMQVLLDELITEPTAPAGKEKDIHFMGWYKDEARTQAWDFNNDKVTGDLTLYAAWQKRVDDSYGLVPQDLDSMYGDESKVFNELTVSVKDGARINIYDIKANFEANGGAIVFECTKKNTVFTKIQINSPDCELGGPGEGWEWNPMTHYESFIWENDNGAKSVEFKGAVKSVYEVVFFTRTITEL